MCIPRGLIDVSWSATRTHFVRGTMRWKYAIVAMHSASIDGSPKAGPHTCSSSTMLWSCFVVSIAELLNYWRGALSEVRSLNVVLGPHDAST